MEPNPIADPDLLDVLHELMQCESRLHHPEPDLIRADFERMVDAAFWEVGASGRRYSRESVLDVLERRVANQAEEAWSTRDAHCFEIAADNYLLTYTLTHSGRVTHRASLWRRTGDGWKIVYHQGTITF